MGPIFDSWEFLHFKNIQITFKPGQLCLVDSISRFSFFGQSDQKRKKQLSCSFIFCTKNWHFA